ncbi:MAG: DUF4012 domain-containing protein, partial [Actinomycetota bacterium]
MRGRVRLLIAIFAVLGVLGYAVSTWAAWNIGRSLQAARYAMGAGGMEKIDRDDLREVEARLESALAISSALPVRAASILPVADQNLNALGEVLIQLEGAVDEVDRLWAKIDRYEGVEGWWSGDAGMERLEQIASEVRSLAERLGVLGRASTRGRSGWTLPPLWEGLKDLSDRLRLIEDDVGSAAALARVLPDLMGASEPQRLLVVVMNNAETRGAGGFPSAVGEITIRKGEVNLGRFAHHADLASILPKLARVPAPADLKRRYGRYGADTTSFVNVTMSPDVPEVAEVLRHLYRKVTGRVVDGVFFVDLRGLQALLPEVGRLRLPGLPLRIGTDEVASFLYSDIYAQGLSEERRRDLTIELGMEAFGRGLSGNADLGRLSEALKGGHIRIASFDPATKEQLQVARVTGELGTQASHRLFVATQNLGADKLDFWARRTIQHRCRLTSGMVTCETRVRITNVAPAKLPPYVTQGRRRAEMRTFLETYLPEDAEISNVSLDGQGVAHSREYEDGL